MSMIANLDGAPFTLPQQHHFAEAIDALEHDEGTIAEFTDDPMQWISLLAAVGNYLYAPNDFTREQLVGHFASTVDGIYDTYRAVATD